MLSCYAPTYAAKHEEKNMFYSDLQIAINEIPTGEPYILLGDFNAQAGSRSASGDPWSDVCGPRGFGS